MQVIDYGQCVICVIITVEDEPEAAPERLDHLGICGVLHLPCVIAGPELKAPDFITLNDGMGNIPEQLVNMLETLCRAVKADVIVPAAKQRIEEVGIEVILKAARVHLNGEFIHSHDGDGQSVLCIINGSRCLAGLYDLRKAF